MVKMSCLRRYHIRGNICWLFFQEYHKKCSVTIYNNIYNEAHDLQPSFPSLYLQHKDHWYCSPNGLIFMKARVHNWGEPEQAPHWRKSVMVLYVTCTDYENDKIRLRSHSSLSWFRTSRVRTVRTIKYV